MRIQVPSKKQWKIRFVSSLHVVADYVSFATTFFLKRHRLIRVVAPLSAKSYADCGYTLVNVGMMPQLFAGLRLAVLENHFILFLHVEV